MNQIQYADIKLNHDEMRRLQEEGIHHYKIIKVIEKGNKTISRYFSLDSQGILHRKLEIMKKSSLLW